MKLTNKHIAYLIEEGFEDLEFWVPLMRLREEGARVTVVGSGRAQQYTGKHCLQAAPDVAAAEVSADDFDARGRPGRLGAGQTAPLPGRP